jgi:Skp family chaperone for outer membrane proteins
MESSPTRPIANRPLNHSGSSLSSRNQYQHSVTELHSSNGGYIPQQQIQQNGRAESAALPNHQQAPFFERVGVRGDVKVVQNYSRIVKQQNARLKELEKIHKELEARLETEAKQKDLLEATLEQRESEWERRLERTVAERDHFKQKMNEERAKNDYLSDQLSRKDQDIHRMMQRKVRLVWNGCAFSSNIPLFCQCSTMQRENQSETFKNHQWSESGRILRLRPRVQGTCADLKDFYMAT